MLTNIKMYIFPLFAIIYTYVICKSVDGVNRRLLLLNALVLCIIALLMNYTIQITAQWPLDSLEVFISLPPNIICVTVTQMIFAVFFGKRQERQQGNEPASRM